MGLELKEINYFKNMLWYAMIVANHSTGKLVIKLIWCTYAFFPQTNQGIITWWGKVSESQGIGIAVPKVVSTLWVLFWLCLFLLTIPSFQFFGWDHFLHVSSFCGMRRLSDSEETKFFSIPYLNFSGILVI